MDGSDPNSHMDFKDKKWDKVIMPDSLETVGSYAFSSLRRTIYTNSNLRIGELVFGKRFNS